MIEISKRMCFAKVEQVDDLHYVCNKCGVRRRKMLPEPRGKQFAETEEYVPRELCDEDQEASAFLHVSRTGGFGDRAFGDGVKLEFDLCQDCLLELVKSFEVPATVTETMQVSPYARPFDAGEPPDAELSGAKDFYAEWATWGNEDGP